MNDHLKEKLTNFVKADNITEETLRETFTTTERYEIVKNTTYECLHIFNKCVNQKIALLSSDEAWMFAISEQAAALGASFIERLGIFFSQEKLREFCLTYGFMDIMFHLKNANYIAELLDLGKIPKEYYQEMICRMDNDELKVEYMKKYARRSDRGYIVQSIEDDEIKMSNLKFCPIDEIIEAITTLKSDQNKEKYINKLPIGKGRIIRSLESDSLREKYFNKYFSMITADDKGDILAAFKDVSLLEKYQDRLKSDKSIVQYFFSCRDRNIEDYDRVLEVKKVLASRIKGEKDASKALSFIRELELRDILLKKLRSFKVIKDTVECSYHAGTDIPVVIDKLWTRSKEAVIRGYGKEYPEKAFEFIGRLKNFDSMERAMAELTGFPMYEDKYEFLVDLASKKYKLNRDHLLQLARVTGCAIFASLKKQNIIKIINSDDEVFKKVMMIFNKQNIDLKDMSQNDVLNALIQRKFRLKNRFYHGINNHILTMINAGEYEEALKFMAELEKYVDFSKNNTTSYDLFAALRYNKTPEVLDTLSNICNQYLRLKRSEYLQTELDSSREKCCSVKYDKAQYVNAILKKTSLEDILYKVTDICDGKDYNEEEIRLVTNRKMLIKLINFKKDPLHSEPLVLEEKKMLPVLINVIDKNYNRYIEYYREPYSLSYEIKEAKSFDIVKILESINLDQLVDTLFNDEKLFKELLDFLGRYRLLGWGDRFDSLNMDAGVTCNPLILAALVNNFKAIRISTRKSLMNDTKRNVDDLPLTAVLDRAGAYDTESLRYSLLMGRDNVFFLKADPAPNSSEFEPRERLEKAVVTVRNMYKKTTIPVPGCDKEVTLKNNKKINVIIGNSTDMINLTTGERTGACTRIGGAADNLFHHTLEGKRGFMILFKDMDGEFVSRIMCFRNGNTVYMNQLKESVSPFYKNEDLIEATQMIAQSFIEDTKDTESPVENVVINTAYGMASATLPMATLDEKLTHKGLPEVKTDVDWGVFVLATTDPNGGLVEQKPDQHPVMEYPAQRGKRVVKYGKEAIEMVAHFQVLETVLNGHSIDKRDYVLDETIVATVSGEDWIVSIDKNGCVEKFILNKTERRQEAMEEMKAALSELKQLVDGLDSDVGMQIA